MFTTSFEISLTNCKHFLRQSKSKTKNMKPTTQDRDISQSIIYVDLEQLGLETKFQPPIASSIAKIKRIQLDVTDVDVFLLEENDS